MQELEMLQNERLSFERLEQSLADLEGFAVLENLKPEESEMLEQLDLLKDMGTIGCSRNEVGPHSEVQLQARPTCRVQNTPPQR